MNNTEPPDISVLLATIGAPRHALTMRELKPLSAIAPEEYRQFQLAWRKIAVERRLMIVQALVDLAEDNVDLDFRQILRWCLEDEQADVRLRAIEGLWEHESPAFMRQLITMMRSDPAESVRVSAATALSPFVYRAVMGEIDEDSALPLYTALVEILDDQRQPAELRRRALESAGYFADEAIEAQIARYYASNDQLLCESALMAMGRSMLSRWLPMIAGELVHTSPARRYEAARAAGEYGEDGRSLVPQLVPLLNDTDNEVAEMAIWALGQIGGSAARRALQQMSNSRHEARRQAAIEALEELELEGGSLGGDWRQGKERQN
ncbi:MAG TPA: HEAT repeat domain-containing protein [Roseiflexaceae bacterium]|nr:HEAT repeat domain-containing protein [Roseiflexaceae bacterium]HMP40645.1 HEAT repeat domain-containing protein [Roseiflexaceae bacterium]